VGLLGESACQAEIKQLKSELAALKSKYAALEGIVAKTQTDSEQSDQLGDAKAQLVQKDGLTTPADADTTSATKDITKGTAENRHIDQRAANALPQGSGKVATIGEPESEIEASKEALSSHEGLTTPAAAASADATSATKDITKGRNAHVRETIQDVTVLLQHSTANASTAGVCQSWCAAYIQYGWMSKCTWKDKCGGCSLCSAPTEPGCYYILPSGSQAKDKDPITDWRRDSYGEANKESGDSKSKCEARKAAFNKYYEISDADVWFVKGPNYRCGASNPVHSVAEPPLYSAILYILETGGMFRTWFAAECRAASEDSYSASRGWLSQSQKTKWDDALTLIRAELEKQGATANSYPVLCEKSADDHREYKKGGTPVGSGGRQVHDHYHTMSLKKATACALKPDGNTTCVVTRQCIFKCFELNTCCEDSSGCSKHHYHKDRCPSIATLDTLSWRNAYTDGIVQKGRHAVKLKCGFY
jgi:hypothetical protein